MEIQATLDGELSGRASGRERGLGSRSGQRAADAAGRDARQEHGQAVCGYLSARTSMQADAFVCRWERLEPHAEATARTASQVGRTSL